VDRILQPEILALLIPVFALLIPIVKLLTDHQRKMAELYHTSMQANPAESNQLRQEISELKSLVHQQSIALDNLSNSQARIGRGEESLQNRNGGN
jgi:hypothetical protein